MAGTEAEHLMGALNRQRTTFRWKADGLDAAGLDTRIGASALTLGGLLKHLALVEDDVFMSRFTGEPLRHWGELGASPDDPDWTFTSATQDSPETLYRLWDEAVARSTATLAAAVAPGGGGLDQPTQMSWGDETASLRRLVFDLLEEYGRHTGHADLLREAVDGRVGEDPPSGWRPVS